MPQPDRRLLTVSERRLLAVLFTDIVGSTDLAVEMGDARWRVLVGRHHAIVRHALKRFGGKEIDTAGDGFFATFTQPGRALRCAATVVTEVRELGIEVRAGVHVGELESAGGRVGGIAVHTGARVMAAAGPGEVLVTDTVRDLVSGADFAFSDRGVHALKGIPGEWRLHAVSAIDEVPIGAAAGADVAAERRAAIVAPTLLRRSRMPATIAALALLVVVAVVLLRSNPPPTGRATPSEPPFGSVVAIDPDDGTIVHTVPNALQRHGGGNPKLAIGEGGVWVRSRNLVHVDPATGELAGDPLEPIEIGVIDPLADRGVEVGFRTIWIGGLRQRGGVALLRWNPATDERLPNTLVPIDSPLTDVALGHGSVWLTFVDGHLYRLDGETRHVEARFEVGGSLDGVVVGANGVWVLDIAAGDVTRVDPRTEEIGDPREIQGSILAMAAGDDRVWLLDSVGDDVISIDTNGTLGGPIPVGPDPSGIAVGLGAVWVSDEGGDVYRINPLTGETTTVHVGGHLTAIAIDEEHGTLWMTVGGD
jgi:class 3 adenylate cyclase/streptogramin lyase